jgi:hypothetical protein
MILHVVVDGKPAVVVGYGPGKDGRPLAIVAGLDAALRAVPLVECVLSQAQRKVVRHIKASAKEFGVGQTAELGAD